MENNYKKYIDKFKEGDILMTASNRLISKLIMAFTKTQYSHAGTLWKLNNEWYVIEAQKKGIRLIEWDKYYMLKSSSLMILRPKFKQKTKQLKEVALRDLGNVKYDFVGLIHQAIFQTTGVWVGRKGKDAANRMYCTEKVAHDYNEVYGIFKNWWNISPKELLKNENFEHILLF